MEQMAKRLHTAAPRRAASLAGAGQAEAGRVRPRQDGHYGDCGEGHFPPLYTLRLKLPATLVSCTIFEKPHVRGTVILLLLERYNICQLRCSSAKLGTPWH